MKHTPEITQKIIDLKKVGFKSRYIAKALGVSKSSVNYVYLRYMKTQVPVEESLKRYLFVDIETLPDIAVTFKRFKANLGQDNILKDGGTIVSIAWRWMGDKKAQGLSLTSDEAKIGDDSRLCAVAYALIEKADVLIGHNCVEKTTPVLKKDLTWVEAGELKVGDEVYSFTEGNAPGENRRVNGKWMGTLGKKGRQLKISKVTSNYIESKPCLKINMSNGDSITCTYDHYWLAKGSEKDNNYQWRKTEDLKVGQKISKYLNVWEKDKTYEAGWLSGFIAGEGSLGKNSTGAVQTIQICQRPGRTWDKAREYSDKLGYVLSEDTTHVSGVGRGDCRYSNYLGGKFAMLEMIGKLNIDRMLDNINYEKLGTLKCPVDNENYIISIENVGYQDVAVLSTSERTFFAGGYPMHNCDNFDLPMIKSRLLINKFQPPKKIKTIDTLKIARQMRFPSNRLGSLGVILGEGDKAGHSGIKTWIGCLAGNQDSLDEMLTYNLEDVDLLYRVYMRLRAYDVRPLNSALFVTDETPRCPVCGSDDIHETLNSVYTPTCEYQEIECGDCGTRSRGKVLVNTKTKRSSLLAN